MTTFLKKTEIIIHALQKAGYDPYAQLRGYLSTGDPTYITRQDNARALIAELDIEELRKYLQNEIISD